jgi:hypothetical protein
MNDKFIYFSGQSENPNYKLKKCNDEYFEYVYVTCENRKLNLEELQKEMIKRLKKIDLTDSFKKYKIYETIKKCMRRINDYTIILIFTKEKIYVGIRNREASIKSNLQIYQELNEKYANYFIIDEKIERNERMTNVENIIKHYKDEKDKIITINDNITTSTNNLNLKDRTEYDIRYELVKCDNLYYTVHFFNNSEDFEMFEYGYEEMKYILVTPEFNFSNYTYTLCFLKNINEKKEKTHKEISEKYIKEIIESYKINENKLYLEFFMIK